MPKYTQALVTLHTYGIAGVATHESMTRCQV